MEIAGRPSLVTPPNLFRSESMVIDSARRPACDRCSAGRKQKWIPPWSRNARAQFSNQRRTLPRLDQNLIVTQCPQEFRVRLLARASHETLQRHRPELSVRSRCTPKSTRALVQWPRAVQLQWTRRSQSASGGMDGYRFSMKYGRKLGINARLAQGERHVQSAPFTRSSYALPRSTTTLLARPVVWIDSCPLSAARSSGRDVPTPCCPRSNRRGLTGQSATSLRTTKPTRSRQNNHFTAACDKSEPTKLPEQQTDTRCPDQSERFRIRTSVGEPSVGPHQRQHCHRPRARSTLGHSSGRRGPTKRERSPRHWMHLG